MPKRPGEMTVSEAAERLGVHRDTVLRWVHEAVSGNGSQFTRVRVEAQRKRPRYYVDGGEVDSLAGRSLSEYA
jgi:excisionase family DNA binding protein